MRKHKELAALFLVVVLLSGVVSAAAAGAGSASDPLIILSWLKEHFIPNTVENAGDHVNDRFDHLEDLLINAGSEGIELRVKRGDVLWLESGSGLTPLAGKIALSTSGSVIDVTEGKETPSSSEAIAIDHRYLTAENSQAAFSVISDTAVIRLTGLYRINASEETDYNALADALHDMGLFIGASASFGSGYELENPPTRIQGLIMFLRLIGEDQAAQNYSGSNVTFLDVPKWALPYMGYAYSKGYAKGQSVTEEGVTFGASDIMAPRDYITLLLRALGYAEGTDFNWKDAIDDGVALGLLTEGEKELLTEHNFLRAQIVYLSYFALSANIPGGEGTLVERLTASGAIDASIASEAMSAVTVPRL